MASRRVRIRPFRMYNPKFYDRKLHAVDITDLNGTLIRQLREEFQKATKSNLKIKNLYYQNQALEDNRSVAHYNLPNGAVLETSANPVWMVLIHVKKIENEAEQNQESTDEADSQVSTSTLGTDKLYNKLLINLSKAKKHFDTPEQLCDFMEEIGATDPGLSRQYFEAAYKQYEQFDLHEPDPIKSLQAREAARLGLDESTDIKSDHSLRLRVNNMTSWRTDSVSGKGAPTTYKQSDRPKGVMCTSCQMNEASSGESVCGDCIDEQLHRVRKGRRPPHRIGKSGPPLIYVVAGFVASLFLIVLLVIILL